jgi:hypothetical protein
MIGSCPLQNEAKRAIVAIRTYFMVIPLTGKVPKNFRYKKKLPR